MKEQLVELLVSKIGLDQAMAAKAVDAILDFFKKNPDQIASLAGKMPNVGDMLGGLFGKK